MSQIVLVSDTLLTSPAVGTIEYNGQFYGTDSNSARGQMQRITQGTVNNGAANPLSSGTAITYTGIPSWAKRISVLFSGVSLSSTANLLIQVGSGSTTISGYVGYYFFQQTGGSPAVTSATDGFRVQTNNAASTVHGKLSIDLITGTTYVASGTFVGLTGASVATFLSTGGTIALGGALDRVVITSTSTDTFDAGSVNILYEG